MARTYVVTGAASGIGLATKELLESQGHTVIGVDLHDADIVADLSTEEGRNGLASAVKEIAGDGIEAIVAVAGVALPSTLTVKVNYFGAIATIESLRPLLAGSKAPRAVVVSSFSSLQENLPDLVEAMESGDEVASIAKAEEAIAAGRGMTIYASTKRAISEWVREQSIKPEWAGAGIPLNAVGPGVILTPMTEPLMKTPEAREQLDKIVPMPLNGPAKPEVIAKAIAWLAGEDNTHMAGQVVFVDGGADVSIRGKHVFDTQK